MCNSLKSWFKHPLSTLCLIATILPLGSRRSEKAPKEDFGQRKSRLQVCLLLLNLNLLFIFTQCVDVALPSFPNQVCGTRVTLSVQVHVHMGHRSLVEMEKSLQSTSTKINNIDVQATFCLRVATIDGSEHPQMSSTNTTKRGPLPNLTFFAHSNHLQSDQGRCLWIYSMFLIIILHLIADE